MEVGAPRASRGGDKEVARQACRVRARAWRRRGRGINVELARQTGACHAAGVPPCHIRAGPSMTQLANVVLCRPMGPSLDPA